MKCENYLFCYYFWQNMGKLQNVKKDIYMYPQVESFRMIRREELLVFFCYMAQPLALDEWTNLSRRSVSRTSRILPPTHHMETYFWHALINGTTAHTLPSRILLLQTFCVKKHDIYDNSCIYKSSYHNV